LDGALARSAGGCRVQVSRSEDEQPTEVSAHYPAGGLTITRRPDGTISARGRVQREGAALEASLELPGGASLDEQALLIYLARPYDAQLPVGAHLVRTYEIARGDERFTLQERGAREPSHTERYEADEGREHLSRSWSESMRTEGRAVMSGRARISETSTRVQHDVAARLHVPAESRRIVTEEIDEAGELILERETATGGSWSASWELRLERDGSGRTIVTDSRGGPPWSFVRRGGDEVIIERTRSGCTERLRHDREGRLLSREHVAADAGDPSGARCPADRSEVTRDDEGRVVRADTIGASEAHRETLTFLYDAAGRPVQLTVIRPAVRAVYAASGRLISEIDEWSVTDEEPQCEPPGCIVFEHAVASSRHEALLESTIELL
jgi:hypothetical protein